MFTVLRRSPLLTRACETISVAHVPPNQRSLKGRLLAFFVFSESNLSSPSPCACSPLLSPPFVSLSSELLQGPSDQRKQTGPEPSKLEACEGVRRQCIHPTLKEERLLGYDHKTGHHTGGINSSWLICREGLMWKVLHLLSSDRKSFLLKLVWL